VAPVSHNNNEVFFVAHRGTSMNPTLSDRDMLEIVPYGKRPIRAGDVILFLLSKEDSYIVHRVVRISPEGITTRGDNSIHLDSRLPRADDIKGRVTAVWHGRIRRKIKGGRPGLFLLCLTRWKRVLDQKISQVLHPIYRFLSRIRIFQHLLPRRFKPKVVAFRTNGSIQQRLLIGSNMIGYYDEKHGEWSIKRPFRLFIDESDLPSEEKSKTSFFQLNS